MIISSSASKSCISICHVSKPQPNLGLPLRGYCTFFGTSVRRPPELAVTLCGERLAADESAQNVAISEMDSCKHGVLTTANSSRLRTATARDCRRFRSIRELMDITDASLVIVTQEVSAYYRASMMVAMNRRWS